MGCPRAATPPPTALPQPSSVDAIRAFGELESFAALGPKVSGTEGARLAAEHILARLTALGVSAEIQSFEDSTPDGPLLFHNVIATIPGQANRTLLIGCHYDTKSGIADFVGANDSASGVAALLELARLLAVGTAPRQDVPTIQLAFFDGEECRYSYGPRDGLHGSRQFARTLQAAGRLPDAVIILDMIADRDLTITLPRNCDPALIALAFECARAEGVRDHFALAPGAVLDDHVPFAELGVPTLNLIDFAYGSTTGANDYWHTQQDTLDKLDPKSIGITTRVVLRILHRLAVN